MNSSLRMATTRVTTTIRIKGIENRLSVGFPSKVYKSRAKAKLELVAPRKG
jgi:hypothetical protein